MAFRIGTVGMVTAAMVSVLTCYTLSLRVSAERSKVEDLRRDIAGEMKDIRALEAELKTRARLPQLQRWNDNVLAMSAPTAGQYRQDVAQLVSSAPGQPKLPAPMPAVVRETAPAAASAPMVVHAAYSSEPATSFDKLRTNGVIKEAATSTASVRGEPVEPRVAPRVVAAKPTVVAAVTAKAEKPNLDSLFGDIDRAARAERSNLVKVSLR